MQTTLTSTVGFDGTGLHSGAPVALSIAPAPADTGIRFRRSDVVGADAFVPARWDCVTNTRLCTVIGNEAGVTVSTIEHVMAALAVCGVHNAVVTVDGPEVPILDGSAAPFVRRILAAGLRALDRPVRALRVLRPVAVEEGAATARLEPAEVPQIAFRIDFAAAAIGVQQREIVLTNGAFVRELADSRTFGMAGEVAALRTAGLARGGSLTNAVVFDGATVLTPGGLRHADEPVRHKMLDAVGDLALAGGPLLARFCGDRAGHGVTNKLLRALFAAPDAYEWVDCDAATAARLPGVGASVRDLPDAA